MGLLILTLTGRVRRLVGLGGGPAPVVFAPVAWRPAVGQAAPETAGHCDADCAAPPHRLLRCGALAVAVCMLGIPLLALTGAVENTGPVWAWLLRGLCYLALILGAVAVSRSLGRSLSGPRGAGAVLIVVGAVVFETGVLDMHVFRVIEIESLAADMVFHNIGPAIAVLGALVLLYGAAGRRKTSRRSSRSTVTDARPSSSAMTLPSVPPVTM
ncbi:MAG: hypothetical protein ACKOQ4_05315 [Mycobacterium sp.]